MGRGKNVDPLGRSLQAAMMSREKCNGEVLQILEENWSSLSNTMYTLFMCITGGTDWGAPAPALYAVHPGLLYLLLFYVAFCLFAVLNVFTSMFVGSALESVQFDLDCIIHNTCARRRTTSPGWGTSSTS